MLDVSRLWVEEFGGCSLRLVRQIAVFPFQVETRLDAQDMYGAAARYLPESGESINAVVQQPAWQVIAIEFDGSLEG